jgi:ATP-binding cassette subfamily B protein
MGFLINDTQNFFASVDKIFGMVRKKIYIETPEDAAKPERLIGKVEFEQVSFKYDRHGKITELDNISFVAEPGETIGIVGATGAGKSTLVSLISRFYDTSSGRVLVDGKDVREYDLQALRRNIAMASQDVFLFSDTVEGNIAYGDPEAPVEMVEDSARDACAHSFILEMEEGYDSIVGERGVGLSGGQKQRLSLARAFAADPAILILDDTTSAVDMETEHEMQKALKRRSSKCTTFIIAHRISSVKNASKILFMENGRIAEQGTHEELLALKGRYYGMFVSQYGDFAKKVG